jgi:hypothetical protein
MSALPNSKAALVGFLVGQGHTAPAIARALDDGTTDNMVKHWKRKWKLSALMPGRTVEFGFDLSAAQKADLNEQAGALGISPSEFVRRILVCVLDDDLYPAVIDGRF